MNKKRMIVLVIIILSVLLIIGGIVHLASRSETVREDGLTEEQYQLLVDSLMSTMIEGMNPVRRRNAFLILDVMRDIGFSENVFPGESGVGGATWILEMLSFGELQEVTILRYQQCYYNVSGYLRLRIVSEAGNIYHTQYFQHGGLGSIRSESQDGEIVFSHAIHTIIGGQICDRFTGECR